jgi:ElaB/YqjD/DUF883 family membrane-anchored ribosome-binding protein
MVEERTKSEVNGSHVVGQAVPKVLRQVKSADDKLVSFVEERPVVALGVALALGYLVGRVLTRVG